MARKELDEWLFISGADLRRMADELASGTPKPARGPGWTPNIDLLETPTRIWIVVELAGITIENVGIFYSKARHSVTVRGVRDQEALLQGEKAVYHQLEIDYGDFSREIKLPESPIEAEKVRATYQQGFLTVMIPKASPSSAVFVQRTVTIRKK